MSDGAALRRRSLRHDARYLTFSLTRALHKLESGRTDDARQELAHALQRAHEIRRVLWTRLPLA